MIEYRVSFSAPHRHFIQFEATIPHDGSATLDLQLAAWRPGRYELGNFAKNIRAFKAMNAQHELLSFKKITKDLWRIDATSLQEITISYEYYGHELNAGSSYLDSEMLFLNPVNCFFYKSIAQETPYRISFDLPARYQIATGLNKESTHVLHASGFDELADCPLIASPSLEHLSYESSGIVFHIWIQGKIQFQTERMLGDFKLFTDTHFSLYGDIPCKEYHFLFHFPPYFVRHGVEHRNSTVIAMGPWTEFGGGSGYLDLLAISCHELFHTWNIKSIRPIEMQPYDFTKENYSEMGYVAEGVTTFYGDELLHRTGLMSEDQWHSTLAEAIQEHMDNPGRHNISVAQSSLETWLDGYGAGIPWRKVSIYNEGCLIAYICDARIRQKTNQTKSLDDVMRRLYAEFGKTGLGYTRDDYKRLLEEEASYSFTDIFDSLIEGTGDYLPFIIDALNFHGLELRAAASPKFSEAFGGFGTDESSGKILVSSIYPTGPADQAGLWYGDEIVSVNGQTPYKNFQNLLKQSGQRVLLKVHRKNGVFETVFEPAENAVMLRYLVARKSSTTSSTEG
jgi:predicted metalloprotease with PDZ domain